ncbi:hypothetical protein [Aureliella helgolandensis]|uniref:hypothetical protein n=1 Tax=Aureliella helgolandensis TaxID=2527968 RepID=UPI0011AAE432|nr:hypothetical protein [Aureliella helgolandensis]
MSFSEDSGVIASLKEPNGNGYGSGGYYDDYSPPEKIIEWAGQRNALLSLEYGKKETEDEPSVATKPPS